MTFMCDYRTTTYVSIQIMTSTSEHVPASRLHHHDEHSNYDQYDHLLLTTLVQLVGYNHDEMHF
jgi:hypothetical protein